MRDVNTKADNVDSMPAANYNAQRAELENAVLSTDQTLDPDAGPDTDLNMLGKAMGAYANAGNVYQDSGVADTYVLSIASNLKSVTKYYDNMMIVFKAGNANTGASTVNIATLGAKSITLSDGTALSADDILLDSYVTAIYSLSNDRFELIKAVTVTSDFPQIRDKSRNLVISNPLANTIDVDADEVSSQNVTTPPSSFIAQGVNLTIDITASGANGLDTGSEASDTWYYIWVIFNGSTVAGLLSTSATAPTMPSGYAYKALLGTVRNDSGSDFKDFYQVGNKVSATMHTVTSTVTDFGVGTGASKDISDTIPPIAVKYSGQIQATNINAGVAYLIGASYSAGVISTTALGSVLDSIPISTSNIRHNFAVNVSGAITYLVRSHADINAATLFITGWEY